MTPPATDLATDLAKLVTEVLEDRKGENIVALEVGHLTTVTEGMVIVSGTSNRHVKSLADYAIVAVKDAGYPVYAVEGRDTNEWVLIDFGHILLHVMQKDVREFYDLERLWTELPAETAPSETESNAE